MMEYKIIENHPNDSRVKYREDNIFQTLSSRMGTGGGNVPMIQEIEGVGVTNNIAGTLDSSYYKGQGVRGGIERTAVCIGNGQFQTLYPQEKCGTLNCMHDQQAIMTNKTVRRLTPIECERLQGWPDNYTNVPLNGKPASDSARYKALGNGMAQPCARWIIQRIVDVTGGETDGAR